MSVWKKMEMEKEAEMDVSGIRAKCLSEKEICTEEFFRNELGTCIDQLLRSHAGAPADENLQRAYDLAMNKVRQVSVTLAQKGQSILKQQLAYQQNAILDATFAKTSFKDVPLAAMVAMYKKCFFRLFDNDMCVSFETEDKDLGKKINLRDLFYLTMWIFATCRREPGDHLLQLAVTGISSVGKSTLVENVMLEGGHNLTSEEGVGRYDTGKKNLLLLHDVDLNVLVWGPDADKIRALTRGETTSAKIHSSVTILPPLFVLITSNGRLLDHKVKEKALLGSHEISTLLPSKMTPSGSGRRREEESVNAIKNRFLECYIRRKPEDKINNFKQLGKFQRIHFILAIFPRIVQLLEKYKPSDFYSEAIYFYALSGLKLNVENFDAFYRFAAAAAAASSPQTAETKELLLPANYWQEKIEHLQSAAVESEPEFSINCTNEWVSLIS
jgi:hypothetical protein